MSDVQKRTVFYDNSDGYVRFYDWAIVDVTGFGVMAEPFNVFPFGIGRPHATDRPNVDSTDPCRMITSMQQASMDKHLIMTSFGNTAVIHGGIQYPRTGR